MDDTICPRCGAGVLSQDNQTKDMYCLTCHLKWKRDSHDLVVPIEGDKLTETLISGEANKKVGETVTEKPITIEVKEKDKPFILALTSVGLFAGEIIAAVYAAIFHPTADMSTLKEAITATIGFMGIAWTFYLVKSDKKE